jgi:hypothetical protein
MAKKLLSFNSWQKNSISWSKNAIYLFLVLREGRPSYRRSLQPSKENIQHFKSWNLNFFLFLWVFLPSWILIRIPPTKIYVDPCGSGSTKCFWFFLWQLALAFLSSYCEFSLAQLLEMLANFSFYILGAATQWWILQWFHHKILFA